jgi:hypothetical protein
LKTLLRLSINQKKDTICNDYYCALARLNGRSHSFSLEFSLLLSLFQDKESKRTELINDISFGSKNTKGFQNVCYNSLLKNKSNKEEKLF